MKIQYASDLHLEFLTNREFLGEKLLDPVADILVLSGDIMPFIHLRHYDATFDFLAENFKYTYWLPGNHEYYRSDIAQRTGSFVEAIRDNVLLVNNTTVRHDDVRLIFSTLWSKIRPENREKIENGMADFDLIKSNQEPFTTEHFNRLHQDSVAFLKKELLTPTDGIKTAVFTHHCPTFINYPPQWLDSALNDGFAVELGGLIEKSDIDYWCYGHHHTNTPDFIVGKTKMICNQLGYVQWNEHLTFVRKKYIEL